MSFQKSLLKNIFSYGSFTYSSYLISFISFTILSRLLSPAEYGFVALITVFTGFVTIFSDAGISYAVIRSDYRGTFQRALNNLTFFLGGALFLLVALLAWPIAWFYNDYNLVLPTLVLSLLFIFKSFSIIPQAVLNKSLQFVYIGRTLLIVNICTSVLTIVLAWLNFSYWSLIYPHLAGALLSYFILNYKARIPFKIYPKAYSQAAFEKVKWLIKNIVGFNLINYWGRNADYLIIGKFYSNADLGIYSKAYSLLTLPLSMISSLFGTILFPSLKQLKSQGGDIKKEYTSVLGIISLINWPIAVVLIVFAHPLVDLLWGEKWIGAADFVPYFGLLVLSQTLASTSGNYFVLLNRERTMLWTGISGALCLVISIAVGAWFSVIDIARFYVIGYLLLALPNLIYFGFVRAFGFSWSFVFYFWMPKIIMSLLLLASIWAEKQMVTVALLFVYLLHLLFQQRKEIWLALEMVQKVVSRTKNK